MKIVASILLLLLALSSVTLVLGQSGPSNTDRERGRAMLNALKEDLKKHYYDPNFHGMDIDNRFKAADEKIKVANSQGQIFGIIAQALVDLDDSHTFFIPPGRSYTTEYGWQMQMIGDKCYVVAVKPGSDAAAQGLKEGDLVLSVQGFRPSRKEFWKLRYYYNFISPRPSLRTTVQSPGGEPRELDLKAKIKPGSVVRNLTSNVEVNDYIREIEDNYVAGRHRYYDKPESFIWKMPAFDLDESEVDRMVDKAKGSQALILDLRGNGGGAETTLLRMIGNFLDEDFKVGDINERKKSKPLLAKTRGKSAHAGKLVVLIDSESGSSAELFARVMQLKKRAVVIGDLSAGAVMRARFYSHDLGAETLVPFGVGITNADVVMPDGKSLEHVGVTPDEVLLPSGEDLAAKRDVVMARALELVGVKMTPEKAGTLFPIIWDK